MTSLHREKIVEFSQIFAKFSHFTFLANLDLLCERENSMDWSPNTQKSRRIREDRRSKDSFSSSSEDGATSDKDSDDGLNLGRAHSDGENSFDSLRTTNSDQKKSGKRKGRRRQRHKPYLKAMSWVEKEKKQVKIAENSSRKIIKQTRNGKPGAPLNTTSFLMNEHDNGNASVNDVVKEVKHSHPNHQDHVSDAEYYSSPEDENDFLEKEFSETYATVHAENLASRRKEDVIDELLSLESKYDKLKKELNNRSASALKEEIRKLKAENKHLHVALDYHEARESLRQDRLKSMSQEDLVNYAQSLEKLVEASKLKASA